MLIRDEIRKEARRLRVLPRATSIKLSFFVVKSFFLSFFQQRLESDAELARQSQALPPPPPPLQKTENIILTGTRDTADLVRPRPYSDQSLKKY